MKASTFPFTFLLIALLQPLRAAALGPGEFCFFNAPSGAPVTPTGQALGHVSFGFLIGGSENWIYGGTENPGQNWHHTGTRSQMLAEFKAGGPFKKQGYYQWFKCRSSAHSSVGAAGAQVVKGEKGYNVLTDNCLTKSVEIAKAYDGGTFNGLLPGQGWGPNFYFDHLTFLFSDRLPL